MAREKPSANNHKKFVPNVRLRKAREQRNLKQNELAEKIGVTPVTVSRWENGKSIPTPYYRQKLCEFFQMDDDALGFIPTGESEAASSFNTLPIIWNVPYRHNPFFTGREATFKRLHALRGSGKITALTQTQAISGLGGIGKTQVAVEYAYRYHKDYKTVFWIRADTRELIISDFIAIAHLLDLQEKDERDQTLIVAAVKNWLRGHNDWLLILDNADDVPVASDFIDSLGAGHAMLTTRAQNIGSFAQPIEVKKMEPEEGVRFLLRRANIIALDTPLDNVSKVDRERAKEISQILDGLPLALDQAGAYIQETACGLDGYLDRFQERSMQLLSMRDPWDKSDHPESVVVTLSLSFAKVQQANPAAADLLRLCAFLHPDAIPEEIILEGAYELGPALEPVAADRFKLDYAISELRRFSLLERDSNTKTLTIHRLVQAVLKHSMNEVAQRQWAERTVRAVNGVFPEVRVETWPQCQRCLPQAQVCADRIAYYKLAFPETAQLLDRTGYYLHERGQYTQAKPLYEQALAIREQVLGLEHPQTTDSIHNLGRIYHYMHLYEPAEPFYRHALAIREKVLGPEDSRVADSLNSLAGLYQDRGMYEPAEPLYKRALAIREKVLGPEHPQTTAILNNLAALYRRQSMYEQAEPLQQRDLAICEKVLGSEHPRTAISLDNLASIYYAQGKYDAAEPLMKRALAIFEKVLGSEHPDTAITLKNLARLYRKQGNFARAESLFKRALAIRERVLGERDPDVAESLYDLALLYEDQGDYAQAETLYQQALTIYEQTLGNRHPDTALVRENYAKLLRKKSEQDI